MAGKVKIDRVYKSTATITQIRGESTATVKIGDNYYKFSYGEDRIVPPFADHNKERELLFNDLNKVVDDQIANVLESIKSTNK